MHYQSEVKVDAFRLSLMVDISAATRDPSGHVARARSLRMVREQTMANCWRHLTLQNCDERVSGSSPSAHLSISARSHRWLSHQASAASVMSARQERERRTSI